MSEKPSWMPTDESLLAAASNAALYWTCKEDDPAADLRDLIEQAVEKALAEQWKLHMEDRNAIVQANIRVQNLYSRERNEQEARHKREVIAARIEVLSVYGVTWEAAMRLTDLRAELAALDAEVKP